MLMVLAEATAQPRPGGIRRATGERGHRHPGPGDPVAQTADHAYRMRRASFLERAGDISGAMRELAAAQRIQPEGAFDHFLSGLERYKRGLPARARLHFQMALQAQPNHFWAQCLLAICDLNDRPAQPKEAKAYLTACLQTHPEPALALLAARLRVGPGGYDRLDSDGGQSRLRRCRRPTFATVSVATRPADFAMHYWPTAA